MGVSYRNICYDTAAQAQAAVCGNYSFISTDSTGKPVVSTCTSYTASAITETVKIGTGTPVTYSQVMPAFPTCSHTGGPTLALEYFALGLGFLAVIWAAKAIMNIFRGRHEVA